MPVSLINAIPIEEDRTIFAKDHMGVVTADSPLLADLLDWTRDRIAGEPAGPGNCASLP